MRCFTDIFLTGLRLVVGIKFLPGGAVGRKGIKKKYPKHGPGYSKGEAPPVNGRRQDDHLINLKINAA